ncbi:hydroxyethylthiazole kinase [Bosea psychrotolerans]|uniref:Hydroxyethylthiazole kinase n=1 Tax=Bosea psychrotolerans TaxID=1871628 RepID=A0A2S4LUJ7_9HYPH|nr:hydroxyethylthiazole kinase [Bosea psychrotolerans]POR46110.1 hydroxyethylthiazole kinase [Bosea psychrotolerans]
MSMTMTEDHLDAARVAAVLARVTARRPRVQCLTNTVAQNITANMLLAFGAIPSMAIHVDEVAAMADGAGAILINIGTINAESELAIPKLLEVARDKAKPLVFDPVFVELSPLRQHVARQVLRLRNIVVRGNATEMTALADALQAAREHNLTLVTTGKIDRIEGPRGAFSVAHGHPLMTKVTGVGCAAGALIAAACAVESNPALAAAAALTAYGIAGEIAAERSNGPGSFTVALIDALAGLDEATLRARMGEEG